MKTFKKTALSLETAALAIALAGLGHSTAAFAQDTAAAPAADCVDSDANGVCDSEEGTAIIVTGSRIRSPNATSNIPITTVRSEDIVQQGQNNLGDTLNDLPQLRSTFNQQNPGAGVGITGLNLLDLRGLGTVRTLVLVNGRRHVGSDILNNAVSVDVNSISNDLIERVDIVTGGNSAVYGSDAIAGVVNFVLKRNYEGLQVSGNAGVSQAGYGGNQFISVLAGKNFADGRGNITFQTEYARQEQTYASDIPFLRRQDGFATVDVDPGGLVQNSDFFPDAVFFRDIRSATIHRYGMAIVPQPAVGGVCGYGTAATNGPPNTAGTAFSCNYIFNPDGTLSPQTGTRFGTGPAGTFVGGNGQTGREDKLLSIFPRNERINVNLLAHYDFSDAFQVFFEGKYARTISVGNQLGPTFLNNSTGSLGTDARIDPRLDNPFLDPAARATIANAYLAANCGYTLGSATSAATCQTGSAATQAARNTAIANGSYRFLFARSLTDAPNREELFHRQTYRAVAGIRGDFYSNWHYELSANYGRFEEKTDVSGFVDRQRFLLSLDAGRNPTTGAIQCRSQFDAASAVGAPGLSGTAAAASKLASDIAACVPYNVFGSSPSNQAAVNYFLAHPHNDAYLSQFDVTGFITGDTGHWFNLPGGPAAFSLGSEYRVEKAFNNSDGNADTGLDNFVYLGDVDAKPLRVWEGFGELKLPLIKDVPFFHELTLSGAGRVSHYNNAAGTVWTYNAGGEWSPVQDIRFRVNYGRAIRAPNASETVFPNVPNFANGFIDPCNPNAVANGTAARVTNCQTLSAAQIANLPTAGYSLHVISGSNPNLVSETSRSWTYGVVFQPRFVPGLSISADYFNINVKNTIVSLSAQTIVNSCYDSPNLSSPLCAGFKRNLTAANGPEGELPGQILGLSVVQGPQNFARRVVRGLDVNVNYDHSFSPDVRIGSRLVYTHTFQRSNFENPSIPQTENYIAGELGDPKDEAQFDVSLKVKKVTFAYGVHFIGPMYTSTYEAFNVNNVGVPGQTGLPTNSDAFDIQKYPAIAYQNFKINFSVVEDGPRTIDVYMGVNNITDQNPPLGLSGTGAGSSIYSLRGRTFFAGFKAKLF